MPPVGRGVERLDGSSEVKMVVLEGERMYLEEMVERTAGIKPGARAHESVKGLSQVLELLASNFATIPKNDNRLPQFCSFCYVKDTLDYLVGSCSDRIDNTLHTI